MSFNLLKLTELILILLMSNISYSIEDFNNNQKEQSTLSQDENCLSELEKELGMEISVKQFEKEIDNAHKNDNIRKLYTLANKFYSIIIDENNFKIILKYIDQVEKTKESSSLNARVLNNIIEVLYKIYKFEIIGVYFLSEYSTNFLEPIFAMVNEKVNSPIDYKLDKKTNEEKFETKYKEIMDNITNSESKTDHLNLDDRGVQELDIAIEKCKKVRK